MNIFVLSTNPVECASFHNDKHVVKMIVEYAQLLSSVHRVYGYDVGYKLTHKTIPVQYGFASHRVIMSGYCNY